MQKNNQIEVVKFLGILLVVLGHSFGAGLFAAKLYHMPLFFFVSGLTLNTQQRVDEYIVKRIKRLYLPFVFYEVAYLILSPAFYVVGIVENSITTIAQLKIALEHIILFDNFNILLSPIWFVTALFLAGILSFWSIRLINNMEFKIVRFIIPFIMIYSGLYLGTQTWSLILWSYNFPHIISVVIMASGYIILGYLIKENTVLDINKNMGRVGILCLLFLMMFERYTLLRADMRSNIYEFKVFQPLFALVGIFGILSAANYILMLTSRVKNYKLEKIIYYIANHTFSVMCLHPLAFKAIGIIQVYILGYDKEKLPGWQIVDGAIYWRIIIFVCGVTLPLLCDYLLEVSWRKIKNV